MKKMDTENKSRADLALPNPQESPSAPDIELLEASPPAKALPEKPASPPPQQTWQSFLKKELEFLGVTQVLVGLICLCFGTVVCSTLQTSDFDDEVLLLYRAGYPFWGAVLVRGSLGANIVSSIAAGLGIAILILNLSNNSAYMNYCKDITEDDGCFVTSFITELVLMLLFLTILAFCSAVLLIIYRIGQEFERSKVPDDRLYEELHVYSPIYSALEDTREASAPVVS
uniref:Membrane spanning 4-domains A2 n=5 Tax=Murinae TaxID=39107 RepID=A0ABK0M6N6_RAT